MHAGWPWERHCQAWSPYRRMSAFLDPSLSLLYPPNRAWSASSLLQGALCCWTALIGA